jgi:hypothetical protein
MNAIVVGADGLGNIPEALETIGIRIMRHITGRAAAHQKRPTALPEGTDLLIVFTDFLNHNAMRSYRDCAAAQGIRVVACRRSLSCLMLQVQLLRGRKLACQDCSQCGD